METKVHEVCSKLDVINVVLVSVLLTLNKSLHCFGVSTVDGEQVIVGWAEIYVEV